jgi:hypothetical protein
VPKKIYKWKIYLVIDGGANKVIGSVYATDEEAALKAAIKEYKLSPDTTLITLRQG